MQCSKSARAIARANRKYLNGVDVLDVASDPIVMARRASVVVDVEGRALLGPAVFPVKRPKLKRGEKLKWMKAGWVIVRREARPAKVASKGAQ